MDIKGKGDKWLCGKCNSRPPAGMTVERDNKHYCLYCGEHLEFEPTKEEGK